MSEERDDAIEVLLHKQFEGPVPDEGFGERVMRRLPQRRRHRVVWPVWGGALVGAVAGWLVLLSSPLLRTGWRDWANDHWSASAITVLLVMLGMVMLALVWAVAEADGR